MCTCKILSFTSLLSVDKSPERTLLLKKNDIRDIPFHQRYFHPLSTTFVHFQPLSCTFIPLRPPSSTCFHLHPLASTFIHFHPLSSTFTHFHLLSSTLSNTVHWSISDHHRVVLSAQTYNSIGLGWMGWKSLNASTALTS